LALGFGFLGAFPAAFIESKFLHSNLDGASLQSLISMMGIGFVEEVCKFLPLAIYIYKKRYFNEHTDGVIYFALAGVGFGMPENILYTVSFGAAAGMVRIVLTPIFHAAITAMVGYYLAKGKIAGKSAFLVVVPLTLAIVLHGLYDFGLGSGNAILMFVAVSITFGLSGALFLMYARAGERDQAFGLSPIGNNAFCRWCGTPNPNHNLYCTRCGKNA
jgi:RsiW-degrading membrane proteinase PrsW (M82 family)